MLWLAASRPLQRSIVRPLRFASTSTSRGNPLRILFCGSDEFSCHSLEALHKKHKEDPNLIESIDVLVRPSKPTGRGLKQLTEVPIASVARELGLPLLTLPRDTFTDWFIKKYVNLIVAVSFGRFVPPRILKQAEYGGVNVHPSLLPDLRGPAPLHYALLNRYTHTGVSIQTLSPDSFDTGTVLSQTPLPGIPITANTTTSDLTSLLAPIGASMLVSSLESGLHIPPHKDVSWQPSYPIRHAPKINTSTKQIPWLTPSIYTRSTGHPSENHLQEIAHQHHILGPLWSNLVIRTPRKEHNRRVVCDDISFHPDPSSPDVPPAIASQIQSALERCKQDPWAEESIPIIEWLQIGEPDEEPPAYYPPQPDSLDLYNQVTALANGYIPIDVPIPTTPPIRELQREQTELPRKMRGWRLTIQTAYFPDQKTGSIYLRDHIRGRRGLLRIGKMTADGKPTRPAANVAAQLGRTVTDYRGMHFDEEPIGRALQVSEPQQEGDDGPRDEEAERRRNRVMMRRIYSR
ncbi:putative Methionyl-tRNA formyltransferase [Triangularia verruculosa]|uniref:methionyl-tRNA formyltransferase n=1 Tax=Triangularia verruculosa TaxID=2587418 RepID=A0AAN6XEY8_9PEZI|nr:putative Methionyl-tRNA formyltransferase [Triangularia verruculosa]